MSSQFNRFLRHNLSSFAARQLHFDIDPNKSPRSFLYAFSFSFASTASLNHSSDSFVNSISKELLKEPESDPLSINQRLSLHFSNLTNQITPSKVLETLKISHEAGRTVVGFRKWLIDEASFIETDETLSFFVDFFGRRKDFKAAHEILVEGKGVIGMRTFECVIDRLVRAGRPTQAVSFFDKMEKDYGFTRDKETLKLVIEKLSGHGYASYAEKMVKSLANEIFPDDEMCDILIKGWCIDGKFDEAKRLAGEMYRGGFELSATAYNALIDCVCKLCRKKDPFRMDAEVEKVLVEMDTRGVPRDAETFNVLIDNLCKIRRTQDALNVFGKMHEWGCFPNDSTFLILIKSLYQAARVGEGDEMIDRMRSAGYGEKLDVAAYYSFLKILCGIERLEHAMTVFVMMKSDGCHPGEKTYDLLIGKWAERNRLDKANGLFNEAVTNGVPLTPKQFTVHPKYLSNPKAAEKKERKRETLPEKMARKRRRLKQIRSSFVKNPKNKMRRPA